MPYRFCPLASGSKGNCLYLETPQSKILIDCGISTRALKAHLEELNVELEQLDAVLITHEHHDHISGLKVLCKKLDLPVLCNLETAKGIVSSLSFRPRFKIFTTGEDFVFQDMHFHPFSVQHDTADPVAFTIKTAEHKIGICTDLGFVSSLIVSHLSACDVLYIEANHDPELVGLSKRPLLYKQRVLGQMGHLSNQACAELLQKIAHKNLKRIYLAHLSEECNREELALKTIQDALSQEFEHIPVEISPQKTRATILEF